MSNRYKILSIHDEYVQNRKEDDDSYLYSMSDEFLLFSEQTLNKYFDQGYVVKHVYDVYYYLLEKQYETLEESIDEVQ